MLLIDDYKLEYKLGSGSFADVYYTTKKGTSEIFATKRVDKTKALSDKMKNYFLNEVDILKNTHHQNIIKLHEIKNSQKNFYLIMEYCNGGTLEALFEKHYEVHLKPLPEAYVQHVLRQICCGLYYLHKSNIIHRDLKMENILLHFESKEDKEKLNVLKAQCKIIDFGFAKYLNDKTASSTICGSPISMDPVILKALVYKQMDQNFSYTDKADIWSLGIMFFTMLIGKPPFIANNYHDLYNKINEGNYQIPKTLKLSRQAISLINGLLQYDNKERLSIDQLIFHEFLTMDVKNFEYCDLNYIDKEQSNITLNNKEKPNKIWDNYQVVNNKNLNLSELKGKFSGKSIIDEMSHNNCYDANRNFQAFYIDDNNNIIFTNGVKPANEENEHQNLKTNNKKDLVAKEINVTSNDQNEVRNGHPNIHMGINPTPTSNNFDKNSIEKSNLQDQISERLKKYEDRGKEFKKITAMLQEELGDKPNNENNFAPATEKKIINLTSNPYYESPSTLASTANRSRNNLTSGYSYFRHNSLLNPPLINNLGITTNPTNNNIVENKVTPSNSNNQHEIKNSIYKTGNNVLLNSNYNFETVATETTTPAFIPKPSSSNYFTNVSDVKNNTIKDLSESLYPEKYLGLNTVDDVQYYLTEPNSQREKSLFNGEMNISTKNVFQEKSPRNGIISDLQNTIHYSQSTYLGDIKPNALKSNDKVNSLNNIFGNYYNNTNLQNKSVYKSYHTNQPLTSLSLEVTNPTAKITNVNTKSNFEESSNKKDLNLQLGNYITNNNMGKDFINHKNNPTIPDLNKAQSIKDNNNNYNTNEDIKTAYEIISSGKSNKYNQESYQKHIFSNNNNANHDLNINREAYNSYRNDKGYPFSCSNANIYLSSNDSLIFNNSDINKANKTEQKFPLSQNSKNIVLEMKNHIDKSVNSFNIENNIAKDNQNQYPLQSTLIKIFDDIKTKMNEAVILIEKEGK